MENKSVSC